MEAHFGHSCGPLIPTFSTANTVIEQTYLSLTAAFDASVRAGEAYSSLFLETTLRDFELLFAQNTALFPEIGPPIDTTAGGPLDDLWHGTTPPGSSADNRDDRKLEPSPSEMDHGKEEPGPNTAAGDTSSNGTLTEAASPEEGYLYKYVSFNTLLRVLENPALRFSRMSDFNDPFDGQLLPIQKFGSKQFFDALRDETEKLVLAEDEPILQLPDDISSEAALSAMAGRVVELVESGRSFSISPSSHGTTEAIEPLPKLLTPMIYMAQQGVLGSKEEAVTYLHGIIDKFQRQKVELSISGPERRQIAYLASVVRVLCLTEVPDSLLMWSHYADHHKGAVLKFDTYDSTADYFASARPVKYEQSLPSFETPQDLVRRYLGLLVEPKDPTSRQFLTKSREWKYEKEWRVIATQEMKAHGDYIPFQAGCLAAIYLGCKVTTPNVQHVLDLVTDKQYPTDVYRAVKDDADFALSFVPLSNGRARTSETPAMDINERGRLYRCCLDVYFDFWNDPDDDLHGDLKRLRCEGFLRDFGPAGSVSLFREMVLKLEETHAAQSAILADKEKEQEEYEREMPEILKSSAQVYGALDDLLKDDLTKRGGTLPDRKEAPKAQFLQTSACGY